MKLAFRVVIFTVLAAGLVFLSAGPGFPQKIETVDGVRVVHNPAAGKWGKTPPITLQPVRVIGDVDTEDENFAFNRPSDLAVDSQGRLHVLDTGNNRIQVFDREGKFVKTIGRRGQGPGEFFMPESMAFDGAGNLYVVEGNNGRIQQITPEGKIGKTWKLDPGLGKIHLPSSGQLLLAGGGTGLGGMFQLNGGSLNANAELPPLAKFINSDGKTVKEFGRGAAFDDPMVTRTANTLTSSLDSSDNLFLAFINQNRVEKYASDGRLLWRADRELAYPMEIKGKGKLSDESKSSNLTSYRLTLPTMTKCMTASAVDDKGRLWVVTMARQLRDNEKVQTSFSYSTGSGGSNASSKTTGAVDLRTTDAFKLEIFDADGVLLGSIPVGIFVDGIFIKGDRLFLTDRDRGCQIHEFRIKE